MEEWQKYIQYPAFRLIDESIPGLQDNAQHSFAMDDALAISTGNGQSPPVFRLWVHDAVIILGIPDARLPHIGPAVEWLHSQGYKTVVRNSGGLAVVLDKGILNVSIILPNSKEVSIHQGYDAMTGFIQHLFRKWTSEIAAFEVVGSYCPGDYDLSINGKKFAGISQRRVRDGIAVQIYLCVEGSGKERAALVKQFYETGIQGEATKFTYPEVEPDTMASLAELLDLDMTVQEVVDMIKSELVKWTDKVTEEALNAEEKQLYAERMRLMKDRNEKALGRK